MSETAKFTSPEPQVAVSAPQQVESPVTTAAKSPSPPKSPFDYSEAAVPQATGASSTPANASPPPLNLTTPPSQLPPSQPQDAQQPTGDPRAAGLRAMFPDYDDTILLMVLESVNGDQERAIEALLGMSDPDYKPDTLAAAAQAPALTMSQEELDEQLARRLMIEEQEEQQARWYAQQQRPRPQGQNSRHQEGQYQQPPASATPSGGQSNDTMAEIQQSLTKAAEVGKKTLGDLFTKVKAKIQEFEQGRPSGSQAPQQQYPTSQWAGDYDPQQQQQYPSTGYAQYNHGHGSAPAPGAGPGAAASYYDPNPASPDISEQAPSPPSRTLAPAAQGYDASPIALSPPQVTSASSGGPSVPRPSTSPAPIDGGKLGLLPKRPVSLVRDSQPASTRRSLDSDDGLEYAENPFEDQKK